MKVRLINTKQNGKSLLPLNQSTSTEVAKEAQVKQLILTHISARYLTKEAYQLQEEAQEIFPNTKIVKDMDIIEIPFANEGGA